MTAILLERTVIKRENEEFATASIALTNQERKKFYCRPVAEFRSLPSITQTSANYSSAEVSRYYLPAHLQGLADSPLSPPYPYQFRSVTEQIEETEADDIAVHNLSGIKLGKFLPPSTNHQSTVLPHLQSKLQELEKDGEPPTDEEESFWRGVFALPSSTNILFSKKIEVNVDELPAWEPHVVIDSYRLEDDDE
jgi:hypothetical protein